MSLGVILTYANAGLGHLRVTDALGEAIPPGVETIIIVPHDRTTQLTHRISSTQPILRIISQWFQYGVQSKIFAFFYLRYIRHFSGAVKESLTEALNKWKKPVEKILVVCTHFQMAHTLAAIKMQVEKEIGLPVKLVVQVTDDSPQYVWYVEGADIIFVPSRETKYALENYGKENKLKNVIFMVNPYPLSKILTGKINSGAVEERNRQLDPQAEDLIRISVPVSGAAVGTDWLSEIISQLKTLSGRYVFHIVSRRAEYTKRFLRRLEQDPRVKLKSSTIDREVVDLYERQYAENVISLEITKPSEQAFKAILAPEDCGGVILLLTEPVGRQEYDNLDFLTRHKLIPDPGQQERLWRRESTKVMPEWRGLRLPKQAKKAAEFIHWCLERGILAAMNNSRAIQSDEELGGKGAEKFWEKTCETLQL